MAARQCTNLAIVPAYNEEATVGSVIRALHEHAPAFDVVVIDDGSTDATAAMASRAGAAVVKLPFNVGIGGAVQSGFKYALQHGYEFCVQVDGDGQHDPREISKLQGTAEADPAIDMVVGSRFLSDEYDYPAPIS